MVSLKDDRGLYIYTTILQDVMADDAITPDEVNLLRGAEPVLGIGENERGIAFDHVHGDKEHKFSTDWSFTFGDPDYRPSDMELFEKLVRAALDDEKVSEDEWFILGQLYMLFQVSESELETLTTHLVDDASLNADSVLKFTSAIKKYLD